jgi:hypothetical protein
MPDDILGSIGSSRLPSNVQATLAGQPDVGLKVAVRSADCIFGALPTPALASVGQPIDSIMLLQRIEELCRQVAVLNAELKRLRSRGRR